MVLLHELGHIQRRDGLMHLVARAAAAIYWFNPLVWLALRQLRVERERACDDLVLNTGSPPSAYANHLLEIARAVRSTPLAAAAALPMAKPSQLERRLLAVLESGRNRSGLSARTMLIGSLVACAVLLPLSAVQLTAAAKAGPAPAEAASPAGMIAAAVPPSGKQPRLRYQFQTGQTYVYSVQVESTEEDYVETVTGNVIYTAKAVDGGVATLTYRSHLTPMKRPKPGRTMPLSMPSGFGHFWSGPAFAFGASPQLRVDETGQMLEHSGRATALPQALGDIERLVFEPLPVQGKTSWETRSDCTIETTEVTPLSPMSHFGRSQKKSYAALERISYKLGPVSGASAQVRKKYELKTQDIVGGQPRMQLTGEGTITFDTALGLPRAMEFKGTFVESTENTTTRTPLTLAYKLVEGTDKDKALAPPAVVKQQPKELSEADLKETILDAGSANRVNRQIALGKLAAAKPAARNEEVTRIAVPLLGDADQFTRQAAARVLGTWGTKDAVQPLIAKLDDPQFSVRWAVIDALGNLKAAEAAAPLARRLATQQDAAPTVRALQALGATAEGPMIEVLKDGTIDARREACKVLKEVGTRKAVPALETAARNEDGLLAMFAKEALKSASARE